MTASRPTSAQAASSSKASRSTSRCVGSCRDYYPAPPTNADRPLERAQAINSLLSPTSPSSADDDVPVPPQPLPIRFESGTVGCITVNAAWPLTKLDLAVEDVELVFRVAAAPPPSPPAGDAPSPSPPPPRPPPPHPSSDASEIDEEAALSMSIAHSFVSHELRPDEDAELRASLHLSPSASSASFDLPGAFGGARRGALTDTGASEDEAEKVETTIMARWVERVLARLEVRVSRVRVRLAWDAQGHCGGAAEGEHEHEAELRIDEVLCRGDAGEVAGTRSLEVTPPRVYLRAARAPPGTPRAAAAAATAAESPGYGSGSSEESDDSADENDLLAMSQSIADLRTSFHSSVASSSARDMFHSAADGFSAVDEEEEPEGGEDDPFQNPDGAEADVFATPQSSPHRRDETPLPGGVSAATDDWHLVVSLGPPPSATAAPDPRLAFFLTTAVPPAPSSPAESARPRQRPTTTLHAELSQAWTVALHPAHFPALGALAAQLSPPTSLATPTSASPPPVPKPSATGLRIDLALRAANVVVVLPDASDSAAQALHAVWTAGPDPPATPSPPLKVPHLRLRVDALAVRSSPSAGRPDLMFGHVSLLEAHLHQGTWRILPLLVDDAGLSRTLSDARGRAGSIDSADWLRPEQAMHGKDWRSLPARKRRTPSSHTGVTEDEAREPEPAVRVRMRGGTTEVRLAPVHAFADLGALSRLGPLVDDVGDALLRSPPPHPAKKSSTAPPRRDILDDLAQPSSRSPSPPPALTLSIPLLRLDVRVPAPRRYRLSSGDPHALRGGRVVLDLVDARASIGSATSVDVRGLAAYFVPPSGASTAGEFLRVAPLADANEAVRPALTLTKDNADDAPLGIELAVPLVHVTLDKPTWDGLQLVADDATQFFEELRRASERDGGQDEYDEDGEGHGRERMIGSRYFGAGAGRSSETESTASGTTVRGGSGERAEKDVAKLRLKTAVTDGAPRLCSAKLNALLTSTRAHSGCRPAHRPARADLLDAFAAAPPPACERPQRAGRCAREGQGQLARDCQRHGRPLRGRDETDGRCPARGRAREDHAT